MDQKNQIESRIRAIATESIEKKFLLKQKQQGYSVWIEKVFSTKQGSRNQAIKKKSLLMKVKEESKKAGLKPNIQKTKIMASSPITQGQIDVETMETLTELICLGSKITADGDCSHEIKRCLFLGRKAMTNLDSLLKSRDITCKQRSI